MNYHFIGIGGVAMAQMAAWMKSNGAVVTGSDQGVYPPMSDFLAAHGLDVQTPYGTDHLDSADVAVIGNAVSRGNPEVEAVLAKRLPFVSLPQLIHSQILKDRWPIVVAGTHGKTTITAALAQILKTAGFSPGYLVGGLPVGWDSGFATNDGRWFVIEGDEYDSAFFDKRPKFLHYQPQVVLLNNLEFDHADIYASLEEIHTQFGRLIQLIPQNGCLIVNGDEPNLGSLMARAPCPVISFGMQKAARVRGDLVELTPHGMTFTLTLASGREIACSSPLWGRHQLSNLIGAAAAAEFAGAAPDQIAAGFAEFRGVRRRLELRYQSNGIWLYDDFAHHPTAVRATMTGLRARHPGAVLIAAFEPRSNTMVRNLFQDEIGAALALADRIIIGAVHRKERIPENQRLDVPRLCRQLQSAGKTAQACEDSDAIAELILQDLPDEAVIVLMSNGAFSGLCDKLLVRLGASSGKHG